MPKYEIGYILSSGISDDEVPGLTAQISKSIEEIGGKILNEDHWGRKKLAYPIGRTRNGYYAFLLCDLTGEQVREVEHKLLTTDNVIRFMIVNMEEADKRKAKDEANRSAASRAQSAKAESEPAKESGAVAENLDQEIDKAISGEQENV